DRRTAIRAAPRARRPAPPWAAPAADSAAAWAPAGACFGGSRSPWADRALRTSARSQAPAPPPAPSRSSLLALERRPQQRRDFFLYLHERLSPFGTLLPPRDVALLLRDLLVARIGRRHLRSALLRGQPLELASVAGRPPGHQVRGIQPLAPKQRTDLTRFVHRSASRTIRRLYSAVNRRRSAFATTSTSVLSAPGGAPAVGAPAGKTPVALRAPSVSPAPS